MLSQCPHLYIRACLNAAGAATLTLVPVLLVHLMVFQPEDLPVRSLGWGAFTAFAILLMSPYVFGCFLVGAALLGPLTGSCFSPSRDANVVIGAGIAGFASAIAVRTLIGTDALNEIVTSVAVAGSAGGVAFQQRLRRGLKPPPVPSA